MTDRLNYQAPTVLPETMPQVITDNGAAEYAKTVGNTFLSIAGEAHQRQLQSDLDMAKQQGEKIGYNAGKDFKPIKSGSLFARTYNDSGVTSAVTRMTTDTQRVVKDYYIQKSQDPKGLESSLQKYRDEYVADLPDDMQTPFMQNFDRMATTVVDEAKSNLQKVRQSEAQAQFEIFENELDKTVEQFSKNSFKAGTLGQQSQLTLGALRRQYAEVLMQHGPTSAYSVGGYSIKAGPGRSNAFTPAEIQKKLIDFDKKALSAGLMGNFQDEVEAGRGVDAYMAFANGKMNVTTLDEKGKFQSVPVATLLTNKEMESISSDMRTFMNGIRGLQEAEYKQTQRAKEEYNDNWSRNARSIALQVKTDANGRQYIAGGNPTALSSFVSQGLSDPMLNQKTIDEAMDLQKKIGNGHFDDPVVVNKTSVDIATGAIASYAQVPAEGIADATRVKMYEDIDKRNKGQHWSTSRRYQIASDYADAVLAPQKAAGFNIFSNANEQTAADRAEWSKRMIEESLAAEMAGTLPQNPDALPTKDQFDFVGRGKSIADEIATRRNAPKNDPEIQAIDKEIKEIEQKMANPQATDDAKAIAQRYRELQDTKATIQTKKQMGAY